MSSPRGAIVVAPSPELIQAMKAVDAMKRDDWRVVEPPIFGGEPISLRVRDANLTEVVALAGHVVAGSVQGRVTATLGELPGEELLAIALAANGLTRTGNGSASDAATDEPDVEARATLHVSNRPPSFYAPLAKLLGPAGMLVPDDDAGTVTLSGHAGDVESLRRAIAAIEAMLAPR
jgi:hypothetical protein